MKLSIVLSAQSTRFAAATFQGELARNIAHIASLGYNGVELAIREPAAFDPAALLALLVRYGLGVPAIGTGQAWSEERLSFTDPQPQVRRAAIERAKAHVPFASQVGAQLVIGLLRGVVQPGVTLAQAWTWLVEALREVADAAARRDVKVCLEPLNRYETDLVHTVDEGLALLEQVGAENVGLLLDTFHMNIEEVSFSQAIRTAGARLFHFHVADSNRRYPGAGHIDFGGILQTLSAVGYSGYISGEFLPEPDADSAAAAAIHYLRSL
ncbi:MAG TPA: 5-keto-L-gluconate epimerase [Anaerolineae bacterium]|nr:5-keto-L-gluconate epimerase [Anaerolineae bacterium]HQH37196.1 5-keto-L-gluconate epimerase [Anaerolineae bacterium]